MVDSEPRQENITIGGVEIPVIHYEGDIWYPANYINRHLFKRPKSQKLITKSNESKLEEFIKTFNIDYGHKTGGIQSCKCLNKDGLYLILKDVKIGALDSNQKSAYNELVKYLGLDIPLLLEKEIIKNKNEIDNITKNYSEFVVTCIEAVLKFNPDIKWRRCNRCGNTYPLHNSFFNTDNNKSTKREDKFMNFCKECGMGNASITHLDDEINDILKSYSKEFLLIYKNKDVIEIYEYCVKNNLQLPTLLNSKENYLLIIKYLYENKLFTREEIRSDLFKFKFKLQNFNNWLKIEDIFKYLFNEDCFMYPWRHLNTVLPYLTFKQGKDILNNYISEFNIKIDNIFTFDYDELLNRARLWQFKDDILGFVVSYYDYKYAGYKFKLKSIKSYRINYYKVQEHRNFDLKYFIEQDMKIPVDKIPLYLTKMTLQRNCRHLYNLLYSKNYYQNLYEWVNEIYPNKFIENDFCINSYRDIFDSEEESIIHDILHENFTNLIYNQRNTSRTVTIDGMIPDWLMFTNNNCWLVEYFGLFVDRKDSTRIDDYRKRTLDKIEKYNRLDGYKFLAIYPDDLKDKYSGLNEKIKNII